LTASEIVLSDGATFVGKLLIPEAKLSIEAGVGAQFDSIVCDEITVEGNVKLASSLFAEKIVVLNGGVLSSPTLRAASIEVSPGGHLQGRIEKYVPRKAPVEPSSEEEPRAEAA
jgi:hypothetical protein